MVFLCGLFIPVESLPLFLQPVSYLLPLTYGADILKVAVNGNGHLSPALSFSLLLAYSFLLFAISTDRINRKWIS